MTHKNFKEKKSGKKIYCPPFNGDAGIHISIMGVPLWDVFLKWNTGIHEPSFGFMDRHK